MPQATRKRLEELYRCHVFDHIGGTEPCAWAGMFEVKEGMHIIEPFFLIEILDREMVEIILTFINILRFITPER